MKKAIKIILIVVAALIVLVIAALKLAPGFAKDYVVSHSEELIGRKIAIENLSLNPLNFVVNIDKFALMEQDGQTPFVAFEKFRVNVDPLKFITGTASVSEIYMKGLYVHVTQNGDKFNFSDILDFLAKQDSTADTTASSTPATKDSVTAATEPAKDSTADSTAMVNAAEIANGLPFNISVKNIVFENGNIIYEDTKIGSKIHLEDFSIGIPAVYLSDKATDVDVSFKFADGGNLGVKVNANMATNDFDVKIALENFALACGKPYLNDFLNYKDFSGFVTTHMNVKGNLNDAIASNVSGTVSVNDIVLTETSGKTLGVKSINVGISEVNIPKNKFRIDSVVVDGAYAHLDLYKNGKTNIDVLLKAPEKAPEAETADSAAAAPAEVKKEEPAPETAEAKKEEPAPKMDAIIKKLLVKNTSVQANDQTIIKPFNYTVSGITVNGTNINFNTPCAVNVSANFPEGGSLSVKYKGAINDMSTMDAYISVKNLALKHFSNYSLHYTGYPITAGTMAFASDNKMSNFDIESKNTIDIYNIDVGDKDGSVDPEFTVPMKVGLYILKDKDDKIQFDVPVKGNMNDPEFSILKIVWKTVMNLLVKVAMSPLKIVGNVASSGANAIGLDLGGNDEVVLDPLSATFGSEQFAKATNMLKAIQKDPKLKMVFTQYYSPKKTVKEYKQIKLKTDYYKIRENKTNLNELDERAILEISDSDEGYAAYAKEAEAKIEEKALRQELSDMAEKRNQEMQKILLQQSGITAKNIKVTTAPKSELNSYKGKAMYKVTIDVQ